MGVYDHLFRAIMGPKNKNALNLTPLNMECWHILLIPMLKRQRWADLYEFNASLVYIATCQKRKTHLPAGSVPPVEGL